MEEGLGKKKKKKQRSAKKISGGAGYLKERCCVSVEGKETVGKASSVIRFPKVEKNSR